MDAYITTGLIVNLLAVAFLYKSFSKYDIIEAQRYIGSIFGAIIALGIYVWGGR